LAAENVGADRQHLDVISSAVKAPRYGAGHDAGRLIVDGRDEVVFRKAQIAFKPASRRQRRGLLGLLDATREVYNAGLAERRDAYRHPSRTRIGLFDQLAQITDLRGVRDEVLGWGIRPLRWALRRVDEAFSAFFQRVAAGQAPGYPRFKGAGRWDTIGYDEPTGWKLHLGGTKKHPKPHLYLQGIGVIPLSRSSVRQLRRFTARGGIPTTLTLTRVNREGTAWRASVGFKNLTVERTSGPAQGPDSVAGIDRGIAVLVAVAAADEYAADAGLLLHHSADLQSRLEGIRAQIVELQQQRAGKKRHGPAWRMLSRKIKRLHAKAAHVTDNWARHTAKQLVAEHAVLVVEDLNLRNMTRSAKGTIEQPGANVAAKAGLNRSLSEAAPGKLARWVHVKAENAGRRTWAVNPAHTSQQCSACKIIDPGSRISRAVFYCGSCGHYEHADSNAARNIRARGITAEQAWQAAGAPALPRPKPRLRRRQTDATSVSLAA
jgi:putative transposase